MIHALKYAIVGFIATLFFATVPLEYAAATPVTHFGSIISDEACSQAGGSSICTSRNENIGSGGFASSLTNMLLFALGVVAVVMIIYGGIRYATAAGDPGQVSAAKNIILYAVIGLITAVMAWGIVTFVVNQFS